MASNVENASLPVDSKRLTSGSFDQYLGDDFNSKQGDLYTNQDREFGSEYNRNPWGPSENKESGYLGDGTLHMEENAEISSLRQQLEQLSKEEALLKKRTEANDLRRQVAEKKKSVAALRDVSKRSGDSMEDDLNSTEENVPSHHNDTSRSKTPLVQNISEFTITARISQTTIIQKSEKTGKPYAVFSIRVWKKRNGEEEICDVYRRYSDFHDLQMSIAEKIPEFHGPNLPPKSVLKNMSEEFLVKRSKALDGYLQTLLNRELWEQYQGLGDYVLKFLAPVLWEKQTSDLAREETRIGAEMRKPETKISVHNNTYKNQLVSTADSIKHNRKGSSTLSNRRQPPGSSCEYCASIFSIFKRKKPCKDCGRNFCSQCVLQPSRRQFFARSNDYQCRCCQILLSGAFTRSQLLKWKIKDLKAPLTKQHIDTSTCKEKSDLIDLLFIYYGNTPNLYRHDTEHETRVQQMVVRMREEQFNTTPPTVPTYPSATHPAYQTYSSSADSENRQQDMTYSSVADTENRQQEETHSSVADSENRQQDGTHSFRADREDTHQEEIHRSGANSESRQKNQTYSSRADSVSRQQDETCSSRDDIENRQQDETHSFGANSERRQLDETQRSVADIENRQKDETHSSGAGSESRQQDETYNSGADSERRQLNETQCSVADIGNRQKDETHSSGADSESRQQDETHSSSADIGSRQQDETHSSGADSGSRQQGETHSSGADSESRQQDETHSSGADSGSRQQDETHSSSADSGSRQQDETHSSGADSESRQQHETHSSIADSGTSQQDETHSFTASSANTQQKEAHSSCADDENRQENEEDTYDDQNLVDVEEVSRHPDKSMYKIKVERKTKVRNWLKPLFETLKKERMKERRQISGFDTI